MASRLKDLPKPPKADHNQDYIHEGLEVVVDSDKEALVPNHYPLTTISASHQSPCPNCYTTSYNPSLPPGTRGRNPFILNLTQPLSAQHKITNNIFLFFLVPPLIISLILLSSTCKNVTISDPNLLESIKANASTTTFSITLISLALGACNIVVISTLLTRAIRLHIQNRCIPLDRLRFLVHASQQTLTRDLQAIYLLPLLLLLSSTFFPAPLYSGALIPIKTMIPTEGTMVIPNYVNANLLREYPTELAVPVPNHRDMDGVFSYNVGIEFKSRLLNDAATAITWHNTTRRHAKNDQGQYMYIGRSYGVGASVGLAVDKIKDKKEVMQYTYYEPGYRSVINCYHNASMSFQLKIRGDGNWWVEGYLPDSSKIERSRYPGGAHNSSDQHVAIGVATEQASARRYMVFAAGKWYQFLNATECTVDWFPELYQVNVKTVERTIEISPVEGLRKEELMDIDSTRNLVRTAMRQFTLLANDQQGHYRSTIGDAFNASLASYRNAIMKTGVVTVETDLKAVEMIVQSMADEILVTYGAAQIKVAQAMTEIPATLEVEALKFGSETYIYVVLILNFIIMLVVLEEAFRTRGWRGMSHFDHTDPRSLVIAGSAGGSTLAEVAKETEMTSSTSTPTGSKSYSEKLGRIIVNIDSEASAIRLASDVQRINFAIQQNAC